MAPLHPDEGALIRTEDLPFDGLPLAVAPGGVLLADGGRLARWSAAEGLRPVANFTNEVVAALALEDGATLVSLRTGRVARCAPACTDVLTLRNRSLERLEASPQGLWGLEGNVRAGDATLWRASLDADWESWTETARVAAGGARFALPRSLSVDPLDGRVLVGSERGPVLFALNRSELEPWGPAVTVTSAAFDRTRIYLGDDQARVWVLDRADGTVRLGAALSRAGGTVADLLVGAEGVLYASVTARENETAGLFASLEGRTWYPLVRSAPGARGSPHLVGPVEGWLWFQEAASAPTRRVRDVTAEELRTLVGTVPAAHTGQAETGELRSEVVAQPRHAQQLRTMLVPRAGGGDALHLNFTGNGLHGSLRLPLVPQERSPSAPLPLQVTLSYRAACANASACEMTPLVVVTDPRGGTRGHASPSAAALLTRTDPLTALWEVDGGVAGPGETADLFLHVAGTGDLFVDEVQVRLGDGRTIYRLAEAPPVPHEPAPTSLPWAAPVLAVLVAALLAGRSRPAGRNRG